MCQDFAHLTLACLRTHGLAARYVSGYLATQPPPGKERVFGADATHAWAAVWLPDGGWLAVDPTNDQWANDRYITLAWGRDYADVPPVKGVIFTEAKTSSLNVEVDVRQPDREWRTVVGLRRFRQPHGHSRSISAGLARMREWGSV